MGEKHLLPKQVMLESLSSQYLRIWPCLETGRSQVWFYCTGLYWIVSCGHTGLGCPLTQYNRCPHKKTETQAGSYMEAEARAALRQLQDRSTGLLAGHWPSLSRAGKGQGRTSCPFQWSVVPPALWFWTSSFQNLETIHFCCLNYPVCGTLL